MIPRKHEFEAAPLSHADKMRARLEALRKTVEELEAMGFTPPAAFAARLTPQPRLRRRVRRREAP